MAGVAWAVEGDEVGFATESYAASALYTTLASLSGALWRIRRARGLDKRDGSPKWQNCKKPSIFDLANDAIARRIGTRRPLHG